MPTLYFDLKLLMFFLVFKKSVTDCGDVYVMSSQKSNMWGLLSLTYSQPIFKYNYDIIFLENEIREQVLLNSDNKIGYATVDVCDREDVLTKAVLDIILSPTKVNVVFSYMPFHMSVLAAQLLINENIYFITTVTDKIFPQYLENLSHVAVRHSLSPKQHWSLLEKNALERNIKDITFVIICDNNNPCMKDVHFKSQNICVRTILVNADDSEKSFYTDVFKYVESTYYVFFDSPHLSKFLPNGTQDINGRTLYLEETKFVVEKCNLLSLILKKHNRFCEVENLRLTDDNIYRLTITLAMAYLMEIVNWFQVKSMAKSETFLYGNSTSCVRPTCPLGKELKYGSYFEKININRTAWYCSTCEGNRVKNKRGDGPCTPCNAGFKSNKNKSLCFDPYEDKYLKHSDQELVILYCLSGILILLVSVAIFVFILNRKKLIIRSSNWRISVLQMILYILTITALPVLFVGKPSEFICTFRPLLISALQSTFVGITFSKLQKIITVFQKRNKMMYKDVVFITATEYLIVFLVPTFDLCIVLIALQSKQSAVSETILYNKRYRYCTSDVYIQVHYGYTFLLMLFNGVQAFRSRKLPTLYKEILSTIFVCFISNLLLGIEVLIFYSHHNPYKQTLLIACSVLGSVTINFVVQYFYRIYRVLKITDQRADRKFTKTKEVSSPNVQTTFV